MMLEKMVCLACFHYDPHGNQDDPSRSEGECHRHAPQSMVGNHQFDDQGFRPIACWPIVTPDDWCGEWQDKEKAL